LKKKNLIIFGNGKHADTILCEINFSKYDLLGFVIDRDNEYLLTNKNEKISLDKVLNKKTYAFIAVGNNKTRKKIFNNFQKFKNLQWISIISKNSFIQKKVTVGLGTIIMPGVVINTESRIGNNCIINSSCVVEHHSTVGENTHLCPGVKLGGNTSIGKDCFIGMSAVIANNIVVGDNTIIGSQSFLNKNAEKNSSYYGIPAKKKSKK